MANGAANSDVTGGAVSSVSWRVDLFGGPVVARVGHPRGERIKVVNSAVLLAYLACPPRRSHSRETLINLLWPDAPPSATRARLSVVLGELRKENALPIEADRLEVSLPASLLSCDVDDFLAALRFAEAAGNDDALRSTHLQEAVALSSAEFLAGLTHDWAVDERRRLAERRLNALCDLSACRSRLGEHEDAILLARQAVALDTWDERGHAALLRALAMADRSSAALRHYRDIEDQWKREEDQPPARLAALAATIRDGKLGPVGVDVPVPPSAPFAAAIPTQSAAHKPPLPLQITRFFGREVELRLIEDRLLTSDRTSPARLVTLLGSGGSGKTRLALEAASRLREADAFGGNVFFVPLADSLPTADALAGAIRVALPNCGSTNPTDSGDAVATVAAAIGPVPTLLVLDNFEHMADIDAITAFLVRLLAASPRLSLLVTSRLHLDIEGEQEIPVPPLPVAVAASGSATASLDAVRAAPGAQLLLDRIQAVRPGFTLTAENAPIVAALCERLEGIPLAIVLCAAWAGTLSPAQMLERLRNRFDLLVSRRKDIPERHRTLRATVEYSYQQLTPELERLLTGLAVFRGGWTLEAAEAVSGATIDDLDILRERSLIVADELPDGTMRYRMLETLREYAQVLATGTDRVQAERQHASYFVANAEEAEPHLIGPEQATWLARLQTEHDNLRAALALCVQIGDAELGLRLSCSLRGFWDVRGYLTEGVDWLRRLMALGQAATLPPNLKAKSYLAESRLIYRQGDYRDALKLAEDALSLFEGSGDTEGAAAAWNAIGNATDFLQRRGEARIAYERSLNLAREVGSGSMIGSALSNLGICELNERHWDSAKALFDEALEIFLRIGHRRFQVNVLSNLGSVAHGLGDLQGAIAHFKDALSVGRTINNPEPLVMTSLAQVYLVSYQASSDISDASEARALLREAITMTTETGQRRTLGVALWTLGELEDAMGNWERGVRLLGAADALRESLQTSFGAATPEDLASTLSAARAAMGNPAVESAWQSGRRADLAVVVRDALEG